MLYPKEEVFDQNQGIARLVYECSQCRNLEKAREGDEWDNCVYKQDYGNGQNDGGAFKFAIDKECIKDPTLQRRNDIRCPNPNICLSTQAVTFSQPTKDRLNLIFVCTRCTFNWRKEAKDIDPSIMDDSDSD